MANPFVTPTRYEYKPIDMSILAQPMAMMQQKYDTQMQKLDALDYDISSLGPDDDRVKEIEAALGEDVTSLTNKLQETKDFRTSARKLAQLNKFYTGDDEIQAITSNYNAVQEAIKRQRKRVDKGKLPTKQYDEWYAKMLGEFKAKKGTSYNEGKYNTVNTTGRLDDKDKEIQKLALKLSKEAPEQRKEILGKIGALDEYTNQVIDKTWHYKDKNQVANEIYQALKSSTSYKDWTEEMAEYSHYFASQDPDFAANQYGKYMGSYDKAIEKVSNSKLKKKEKETAIAELEKERAALQAAYEADKDGKMKSMYKQQHIESYFQDMAETSADVFDIEPYADIKRTTFQNYEARQTAENNQKYNNGILQGNTLTTDPYLNPAYGTDEEKALATKLNEGQLVVGLGEIQAQDLAALDEKSQKAIEMEAELAKLVKDGGDPTAIEQAQINLNTYNAALQQEYIANAKNTKKLMEMIDLGISKLGEEGADSKLKAALLKAKYETYKGTGYALTYNSETGKYTNTEMVTMKRLQAVTVQKQLAILEDWSKNKIRSQELKSTYDVLDAERRKGTYAFAPEDKEKLDKRVLMIANQFKDQLRNVEGISSRNTSMLTYEDIKKIYEQGIEGDGGYTISDGDMASLNSMQEAFVSSGGEDALTLLEGGEVAGYDDASDAYADQYDDFTNKYNDYLLFENGARKMYEREKGINTEINGRVIFNSDALNEITKTSKNDPGALKIAQDLTDLLQRQAVVGTYRMNKEGQYEPINIDKEDQPNLQNYTFAGVTKRTPSGSSVLVYTPTDYKTDQEIAKEVASNHNRTVSTAADKWTWQNVPDRNIQNYRQDIDSPDQIFVALKQTDLDVGTRILDGNKRQVDYFFEKGDKQNGLLALKQQATFLSAVGPLTDNGISQAEEYNKQLNQLKTQNRDHITETRSFQIPGQDGLLHVVTNRVRYTRDPNGRVDAFGDPLVVYSVSQSVDGQPYETKHKNQYLIGLGDTDQGMFYNNLLYIDGGNGELPYDFNI